MKYWIEVYFTNGKILRKDTDDLNDSYGVFCRYCCGSNTKHQVQMVKSGNEFGETFVCNHTENICT